MHDLIKRQEEIFASLEKFSSYGNVPDFAKRKEIQDYVNDDRICLTLIYFLPEGLRKEIYERIIIPLQKADKNQYYYPPESLHITINNIKIISNPPNFKSDDITKLKYLESYFKGIKLEFLLNGLFIMSNGIAIKAYPNFTTNDFVLNLRDKLKEINVPDDKSYFSDEVIIGNVTICRFYSQPNDELKQLVTKMKKINLGQLKIQKISLISANLVCHPDKTKIFHQFKSSPTGHS